MPDQGQLYEEKKAGDNPLLTVIVPVYNQISCLPACLRDLRAQSYQPMEVLFVDDGSFDGSSQVLEEAAQEGLWRVISQENKGIAEARNTGLDHARGEVIGFLDPDDRIHPDFFKNLMEDMAALDAEVSVGAFRRFPEGEKPLLSARSEGEKAYALSASEAMRLLVEGQMQSYAWNKLCRRSLYEGIRYPSGCLYEDQFTCWRILRRAKRLSVTPWVGYAYVQHPGSITNAPYQSRDLDYLRSWWEICRYAKNERRDLLAAAKDQLVSASLYMLGRMKKNPPAGKWDEKTMVTLVRRYGGSYGKSGIRVVNCKRRILAGLIRLGLIYRED